MTEPTRYFKAVCPDGRTRNGLDWNVAPGTVIRADHAVADLDHGGVCPVREGDGITIAKTWAGAAQAGFPTVRCCVVTVEPADVLAEDGNKARVRAVTVGEWFDATALLRQGWGHRANLRGAKLSWANLSGAGLREANLRGAKLLGANLLGANLREADLRWANLGEATLFEADLSGADLRWANLGEANLFEANLRGANLFEADLGSWERGPTGLATPRSGD